MHTYSIKLRINTVLLVLSEERFTVEDILLFTFISLNSTSSHIPVLPNATSCGWIVILVPVRPFPQDLLGK